jgi:hypothetical protein
MQIQRRMTDRKADCFLRKGDLHGWVVATCSTVGGLINADKTPSIPSIPKYKSPCIHAQAQTKSSVNKGETDELCNSTVITVLILLALVP